MFLSSLPNAFQRRGVDTVELNLVSLQTKYQITFHYKFTDNLTFEEWILSFYNAKKT